ncbi:MAG: nucleotidyltransferase domain-containing protein [Chloroflexi bacterium]|nr:nucleotidyltransferase domain-containing protein [Chloroflexota bacterium]MBP8057338.1 nucleotidyltransferase domain-containing protein [Chloroflexota bacterium]
MEKDLEKILAVLKTYHVKRVILYGSLARGDFRENSDIDICVQGLADDYFFLALGQCLMLSSHAVSLTNLEQTAGYFRERVLAEGKVLYEQGQ